jgi:hypothetical protein
MQFKEHESGQKSSDPKMAKLDKLARLLNVTIHVDGVEYGKTSGNSEKIVIEPEDLPDDIGTTTQPVEKPIKKSTTRKKVVDKS